MDLYSIQNISCFLVYNRADGQLTSSHAISIHHTYKSHGKPLLDEDLAATINKVR